MEQVREKPVEGLAAAEVRIFDLMQEADADSFWDEDTAFKLRDWFTKAIRSYLASGCDPTTLRRALGFLPEVARIAVNAWARCQESILDDKFLRSTIDDVKTFKREIEAADRIVARLEDKEARFRLMVYAEHGIEGGGADVQR